MAFGLTVIAKFGGNFYKTRGFHWPDWAKDDIARKARRPPYVKVVAVDEMK